jgi:hypothetical protein
LSRHKLKSVDTLKEAHAIMLAGMTTISGKLRTVEQRPSSVTSFVRRTAWMLLRKRPLGLQQMATGGRVQERSENSNMLQGVAVGN